MFYYKYFPFIKEFFNNLNSKVIVSPETNRNILSNGVNLAVDESCLSIKIFMGHVKELIGKVDYLLIPRMESVVKKEELCARFQAFPDMVRNIFDNLKIMEPNIIKNRFFHQFMKLSNVITRNYARKILAYNRAVAKQKAFENSIASASSYLELFSIINKTNTYKTPEAKGLNAALLGHAYNIYDRFLGYNVATKLEKLGVGVKTVEMLPPQHAHAAARSITEAMPWTYNREILGATKIYIDRKIDGIIYLTTFPCGPDALSTEIAVRTFRNRVPIINLVLDELEGDAGLDTRLEIFTDMIRIRKGRALQCV